MSTQPKAWSRRQWALYWLFVVALVAACGALFYGVEVGDMRLAGATVALMMSAFIATFIVWVVRLLRRG